MKITIAIILLILSVTTQAQILEIGPTYSTYKGDLRSDWGAQMKVFVYDDWLFISSGFEETRLTKVGQTTGKTNIYNIGVGARYPITNRIDLWGDFSYYNLNRKPYADNVDAEIVGRLLINDHGTPKWKAEHYVYKLESDNLGPRLGITFKAAKHFDVWIAGRFLSFSEKVSMCTGPDPKCKYPVAKGNRHWLNVKEVSFNSVQTGFMYKF